MHYSFFRSFGRSRLLVVSEGHVTSGRATRRSTATTSIVSSHLAMSGGDSESSVYGVRWFSAAENSTTHKQVPAANVILGCMQIETI